MQYNELLDYTVHTNGLPTAGSAPMFLRPDPTTTTSTNRFRQHATIRDQVVDRLQFLNKQLLQRFSAVCTNDIHLAGFCRTLEKLEGVLQRELASL